MPRIFWSQVVLVPYNTHKLPAGRMTFSQVTNNGPNSNTAVLVLEKYVRLAWQHSPCDIYQSELVKKKNVNEILWIKCTFQSRKRENDLIRRTEKHLWVFPPMDVTRRYKTSFCGSLVEDFKGGHPCGWISPDDRSSQTSPWGQLVWTFYVNCFLSMQGRKRNEVSGTTDMKPPRETFMTHHNRVWHHGMRS